MWSILRRNILLFVLILQSISTKNILRNKDSSAHDTQTNFEQASQPEDSKENEKNSSLEIQSSEEGYHDEFVGSKSKWSMGVVHYYLDHNSYDHLVAERVRLAMNTIEEASCIRFKPLLKCYHKSYWIHISNPEKIRECVHETKKNDELKITMVLGFDCMQSHDILHSLMHALGFMDEVAHPKRNQYVSVLWDNIHPGYRSLFQIHLKDFPTKSIEYDPMSVMQFHDRAYSKNGQATIAPLIPGLVINPSKQLSPLDKMKLRHIFGRECNQRKVDALFSTCKTALGENVKLLQPTVKYDFDNNNDSKGDENNDEEADNDGRSDDTINGNDDGDEDVDETGDNVIDEKSFKHHDDNPGTNKIKELN